MFIITTLVLPEYFFEIFFDI